MNYHALWIVLLLLVSIFMILLILIQRGKGGGLAGAFGGMGGQSAFGTKAGDVFTKITVVTALIWFSLCVMAIWALKPGNEVPDLGDGIPSIPAAEEVMMETTPTPPETVSPATTAEPAP